MKKDLPETGEKKMPNSTNETLESVAQGLEGNRIRAIFKESERVAFLYTTLTSKRGNYFRKNLLHYLGDYGGPDLFKQWRDDARVQEYERHINKLLHFQLIESVNGGKTGKYIRTPFGEDAVNAIRGLERDIGSEEARRIYDASLGPYSIQLFLRVYADPREPDFASRKIKYTAKEVGQITYFLPRSVDGLSAIDKLNEAGLLAYEEDGYVYAPAILLRGFYKFLVELYLILEKTGLRS